MNPREIPPITPERWLSNLVEAMSEIADTEHQEGSWLAPIVICGNDRMN